MTRMATGVMAASLFVAACAATGTTEPIDHVPPSPTTVATPPSTAPASPSTAPTTTTTTRAARERLVIHAVGDVNLCDCLHSAFRTEGFDIAFSGLDGLFAKDDLTIVNLECAPSDLGTPLTAKPFSFRCDLAGIPVMAAAGIEVVSLANNHSADYGFEALADGRARIEAVGLHPVGAGSDLAEADAAAVFDRGGWTIAVVGFSGVAGRSYSYAQPKTEGLLNPWFATEETPGVAPATFENMERVVGALDDRVDIVLVTIHQGEFNETWQPTDLERRRATALIDAGADAVVAHHHHRLLSFEYYRNRPIFWGMGNFVWETRGSRYDATAVAEIVVEPDGTVTGRLIPAYIESPGHPVLRGEPDWSLRVGRVPSP